MLNDKYELFFLPFSYDTVHGKWNSFIFLETSDSEYSTFHVNWKQRNQLDYMWYRKLEEKKLNIIFLLYYCLTFYWTFSLMDYLDSYLTNRHVCLMYLRRAIYNNNKNKNKIWRDNEAWCATVHGVAKSWIWISNWATT